MPATCYYYAFTGFALLEEWTCAVTSRQLCTEGISSQSWRWWATPKRSTKMQGSDRSFLSMLWETKEEDPRQWSARESIRFISKEQNLLKGELKNQNPCPENSEQLKVGCVYSRVPGDQTNEDSYTFMSFCIFFTSLSYSEFTLKVASNLLEEWFEYDTNEFIFFLLLLSSKGKHVKGWKIGDRNSLLHQCR